MYTKGDLVLIKAYSRDESWDVDERFLEFKKNLLGTVAELTEIYLMDEHDPYSYGVTVWDPVTQKSTHCYFLLEEIELVYTK